MMRQLSFFPRILPQNSNKKERLCWTFMYVLFNKLFSCCHQPSHSHICISRNDNIPRNVYMSVDSLKFTRICIFASDDGFQHFPAKRCLRPNINTHILDSVTVCIQRSRFLYLDIGVSLWMCMIAWTSMNILSFSSDAVGRSRRSRTNFTGLMTVVRVRWRTFAETWCWRTIRPLIGAQRMNVYVCNDRSKPHTTSPKSCSCAIESRTRWPEHGCNKWSRFCVHAPRRCAHW